MLLRTRKRPGFSLTEVIVALFVMAAGIIALLTLFPLGAVQMGQALRDDRAQTTVLQADAKMRMEWQKYLEGAPIDTYIARMDVSGADSPGTPVLFDPIGFQSYTANGMTASLAGFGATGIPRSTSASLPGLQPSIRFGSLLDDLEFSRDPASNNVGHPALPGETGSTFDVIRQGRYNWAAMLQRPTGKPGFANANLLRNLPVDLKILVFDRRAPGVGPVDAEKQWPLPFTIDSNQIIIPDIMENIPIRVRSWIMDGTQTETYRNANFYRVQSITDIGGGNTLVELQTPIAIPRGSTFTSGQTYPGRAYVFSNLIEVFDRPQLGRDGYQKQTP